MLKTVWSQMWNCSLFHTKPNTDLKTVYPYEDIFSNNDNIIHTFILLYLFSDTFSTENLKWWENIYSKTAPVHRTQITISKSICFVWFINDNNILTKYNHLFCFSLYIEHKHIHHVWRGGRSTQVIDPSNRY